VASPVYPDSVPRTVETGQERSFDHRAERHRQHVEANRFEVDRGQFVPPLKIRLPQIAKPGPEAGLRIVRTANYRRYFVGAFALSPSYGLNASVPRSTYNWPIFVA
jgi:hypothetical protein